MNVIIPGGCKKYIQAPDVCWNKLFKVRMTKLYDQWYSEGVYQFIKGGNMRPSSIKKIIEWLLDPQLFKENITKSRCDLTFEIDSTDDYFIHCLKKGKPCKARRQKLNSTLSILVDVIHALNPFISPSDQEDTN